MKVKSEREVAQSCPTFCDRMDCSLPGSSIHGIFQARLLEWVAIAFCKSPNVGSYKETFVSAQVLVGNRKHTILMGMKGLSTEVCTWLRNPTARFDFTTGLEGAKGRKSVAEALRELQFWRPLGLPRGSCGDWEETRSRAECGGVEHSPHLLCIGRTQLEARVQGCWVLYNFSMVASQITPKHRGLKQ